MIVVALDPMASATSAYQKLPTGETVISAAFEKSVEDAEQPTALIVAELTAEHAAAFVFV